MPDGLERKEPRSVAINWETIVIIEEKFFEGI